MYFTTCSYLFAAAPQAYDWTTIIAMTISAIALAISIRSFNYKKKRDLKEEDDNIATKTYVMDTLIEPKKDIENLQRDLKIHVKETRRDINRVLANNERQHRELRGDIIKQIDTRFDDFKTFLVNNKTG